VLGIARSGARNVKESLYSRHLSFGGNVTEAAGGGKKN
jgi:hypothetical protein